MKNVEVVLVRPSMSENVGTAARAAANMGLGRLKVVEPFRLEREVLLAASTRAGQGHVDGLKVYGDLDDALADCRYVVGTTARQGSHRGPFYTPRALAPHILSVARDHPAALVFGAERTGLTNDEIRLCQALVRIPTAGAETSSLNLAQAVLILGYELLLAASGPPAPRLEIKPAPQEDLAAMYEHLSRTLLAIKFLPDENTDHWLMSFKRIFNRGGLTTGETNLIRGVCRQIAWAVRNPDKVDPWP